MAKQVKQQEPQKFDAKEFDLPETHFISNIENRVFQGIVAQCVQKIDGVSLIAGKFIENIFNSDSTSGPRGIHIVQDDKSHSVSIKVEVNIAYGFSIPDKADEIQNSIADEIIKMTGLHVNKVHVIFRNVLNADQLDKIEAVIESAKGVAAPPIDEEGYSEDF